MLDFLFYFFAAITLGAGALVVVTKNPVNAAMFLIVSLVGMASLFVMLEAFFLALVQVLVYAGAVVVLFLFIIMLIGGGETTRVRPAKLTLFAGIAALALLVSGVLALFVTSDEVSSAPLAHSPAIGHLSHTYGLHLFTTYMLPFQVAGFLLLVAMIGVIVLSKRHIQ